MEVSRIHSEERPLLHLHQQDDTVCQVDIESRRKAAAIDKTVTIRNCRPVRKQGSTPVNCLEAAQCGKSDTETDIPALVRQYGNEIAEFPRELRFRYCLVLIGVLLYLIIQTVQPIGPVTVGTCKGQRGEVMTLTTTFS